MSDKEKCPRCQGPCRKVKDVDADYQREFDRWISTHDELMAETEKLAVKALECLESLDYLLAKKDDGIDWDGVRSLCYDLRELKEATDD